MRGKGRSSVILLLVIVLIVAFAGVIGNQYSGLRRMEQMQQSLDQINQTLKELKKG
jgi:membrane protein insertase Oxa1/YidC/SpoIIIJ